MWTEARSRRPLGILATLCGALALGACPFSEPNPRHCANNTGNAYCRSRSVERPYCALDKCGLYETLHVVDGCVAEEPRDAACYSPCGGGQDATLAHDCTAAATSTSTNSGGSTDTETSTEGAMSTGEDCACLDQGLTCDAMGECVPCSDEDPCPPLLLCLASGACSGCRAWQAPRTQASDEGCGPNDPLTNPEGLGSCDEATRSCFSCDRNADCTSGLCQRTFSLAEVFNVTDGWCVPLERVYHVDVGWGDDAASGTAEDPFATMGHVIELMETEEWGFVGIIAHAGTYAEALSWSQGMVAISSAPQASVILSAPAGSPSIRLNGGSAGVFLADLTLRGHVDAPAIEADFGAIAGRGIQVIDNPRGGIVGGAIDLRNSVLSGNGSAGEDTTALGATTLLDLVYTTVVDNAGTVGASIRCDTQGVNIRIRNSLVGNEAGDSISNCEDGEAPSVTTSMLDTAIAGVGNAKPAPISNSRFVDAAARDYHLVASAAINADLRIAVGLDGDPTTDLDRDLQEPGADYVGADVPQG